MEKKKFYSLFWTSGWEEKEAGTWISKENKGFRELYLGKEYGAARGRWKMRDIKLFMWIVCVNWRHSNWMLKKKFDFDADGNRNTFPGKTPCTPSKALQAHFHSFCCFAVQEHNKKNWNQLENHGNRYNCHGRAVPLFGSHSGPKRVFIPQRAPVKQSARPSRVSDRRYLFKLTSAAASLLSLC